MSYATQQDLIDRFGEAELIELTDRADPATGVIDATVVAGALNDADELINSYISKRYDLPLSPIPARLVRLASEIARYFLYEDAVTERVKQAYDDAVAFLKDLATGKAALDAAGAEPATSSGSPKHKAPERIYTQDTLKGY